MNPDTDLQTPAQGWSGRWWHGPYLWLTVALFLTAILNPVFEKALGDNVQNTLVTILMFAALRAIHGHRWLFRVLAVVVVPVLALNWTVDNVSSYQLLDWLTSMVTQLFFAVVMVTIFGDVLRARHVTPDVIFGSVAVYLLFGVVMAMVFQLLNTMDPGSVIASVSAESTARSGNLDQFLYFSFITLTSVGFGDLSPLSQSARSIAVFEGVVGQLYLAILVARLVGIHVAQD